MAANLNTSSFNSLKDIDNFTENDGVSGTKFEKDPERHTVE